MVSKIHSSNTAETEKFTQIGSEQLSVRWQKAKLFCHKNGYCLHISHLDVYKYDTFLLFMT